MFRVIFLMVIFVIQLWSLCNAAVSMGKPENSTEDIATIYDQLGAGMARVANLIGMLEMAFYVSVLGLNVSLLPNGAAKITFLVMAAAEFVWYFPRAILNNKIYSGTLEEIQTKYVKYLYSWKWDVSTALNSIETALIGWGIYLILTSGHIVGR